MSRKLRELLTTRFSNSELRSLCVDVGVDYDALSGQNQEDKARELVAYLARRDRLGELVVAGAKARPDIDWDIIPDRLVEPSSSPKAVPETALQLSSKKTNRYNRWWIALCSIFGLVGIITIMYIFAQIRNNNLDTSNIDSRTSAYSTNTIITATLGGPQPTSPQLNDNFPTETPHIISPAISTTTSTLTNTPVASTTTIDNTITPSNSPVTPTITPSNSPVTPTITPSNSPVTPTITPSNFWSPEQIGIGTASSDGPALAAFNGRLYAAWKGVSGDDRMFWSSFDGTSWSPEQIGIGTASSDGPALAAFNGRLYAAWNSSELIYWSDTTAP
jgi:hypothetical protein